MFIGPDQRDRDIVADGGRDDARHDAADQVGKENLIIEYGQTGPVLRLAHDHGLEVVGQVCTCVDEFAAKGALMLFGHFGAKQPVPGLQRDHADGHIGQRVSKERGHEGGQDIAPHGGRQERRDKEVNAVKRGERGEDPRPDAARNGFGFVRQTPHPMLDVMKGTSPAAAWPEKLEHAAQERFGVAPLEHQCLALLSCASDRRRLPVSRHGFAVTVDRGHITFSLKRAHQCVQMLGVPKLYVDQQPVKVRFSIHKLKIGDIGLALANQCANASQHAGIVANRQIQRHAVDCRVRPFVPMQVQPAVRLVLVFAHPGAVDGVHHDPLATKGDADDPFARKRLAAGGPFERLAGAQAHNGAARIDLFARLRR
mmetsp:Transcript_28501/g.53456  ORF Transcript_28501/g.53456 Transcript_28501/m.53456 type:complete len:369 (+) Transcript_28501:1672-2778(+)